MRVGRVLYLVGRVIGIVGLTMIIPLVCALLYREPDSGVFAVSLVITMGGGGAISLSCRRYKAQAIRHRDSFLFVTLVWLVAGLFGSLPYLLYGCLPDFASAWFESISGFTTTGASAITDVEILPHGILLWRTLTHWLGGAGIVLLFISLLQRDSRGEGVNIFKAEFTGGALAERVAARIEDNAKAIFGVYLALTAACFCALLATGMDAFDSLAHTFSIVSTGGFSTKNLSLAWFNDPAAEWITSIFLILCSLNLSLYYLFFIRRHLRKVFANQELRFFLGITAAATVLIAFSLAEDYYEGAGWEYCLRQAFFQVSSIISTGGFATVNYDLWPPLAHYVLFLLMFVGGCSGSTAGAIKASRWYITLVNTKYELIHAFRPAAVRRIYYNGHAVNDSIVHAMSHYFFIYFSLIFLGALLLSAFGMDWVEAFTGAVAAIGNVGPSFGSIGPVGNFSAVPAAGKYVLSLLMLFGRLEIYTVMVLLLPSVWKK